MSFDTDGVSLKDSEVKEAHKTLKKPQVKAYLRKLQKKSKERAVKTADDIIAELEKLGFSNISPHQNL